MIHHTGAGWRLVEGDAYDALASLPDDSFDLVLTDPPFDVKTHKTHGHKTRRNGFRDTEAIPFEPLDDVGRLARELLRVSRGWVIAFCSFEMLGHYQAAVGDDYLRGAIWHKVGGAPQFTGDRPGQCGEAIACLWPRSRTGRKPRWKGKGRLGIWSYPKPPGRVGRHPCEKPVPLIDDLLENFAVDALCDVREALGKGADGLTVLDPFAGSAAIGKAALGLGMHYVGIERERRFAADAIERLKDSGGGPMFASLDTEEPAAWPGLEMTQ